jgi:hypothetical protein
MMAFWITEISAQSGSPDMKVDGSSNWVGADTTPGLSTTPMTTELLVVPADNPAKDETEAPPRQALQPDNPYQGEWDRASAPGFQIYTFRNFLYIRTKLKNIPEGNITMYDLVGNEVFTTKLTNEPLSKYQPGLKEGCYLVKVITGATVQTQKVFFEK